MDTFFYYDGLCVEHYSPFNGPSVSASDYKMFSCDRSSIIIYDTETTGFNPQNDDILQISVIDGNRNVLFDSYIKPEKKPYWGDESQMSDGEKKALEINKIDKNTLKNAVPLKKVLPELDFIFSQAELLVGYNKAFDNSFLREIGLDVDKNGFDVLCAYPTLFKGQTMINDKGHLSYKLSSVCNYLNYSWEEEAHNSLGDVKATLFLFDKCQDKLRDLQKSLKHDFSL